GPVVGRAEVFNPLRRVRETGGVFTWSAGLEQENGGVGAFHQAARHHAPRRPRTDDHIVIAAGPRRAAPDLMMMLYHCRSLPVTAYFATLMMVAWVNSSSPSWPSSVPMPDCFAPA